MKNITINNLNHDINSYNKLVELYEEIKDDFFEEINVNINGSFVVTNIMAPLGGLLDIVSENINTVKINIRYKQTQTELQKNEFLTYYGYEHLSDSNNTILPFKKYKKTDSKYFAEYINKWLLSGGNMPELSEGLHSKILRSILEIFNNATLHSNTNNIYVCGQFYPQKHIIALTIADFGNSIKNTVNNAKDGDLSSIDAIKWALENLNSTKIDTPGGYGFDIVKKFTTANKGLMHIVSNDAFYSLDADKENFNNLNAEFPGTIVYLQIRTNDQCSY